MDEIGTNCLLEVYCVTTRSAAASNTNNLELLKMVEGPKKKFLAKVVLLGDVNVGKTTLINKFTDDNAGASKPTVGTDFKSKTMTVGDK